MPIILLILRGSKILKLLDRELHPRTYHCYCAAAIAVYVSHIIVTLWHGFEVEGVVTASAVTAELVHFLMEVAD